jgi:DNA-binding NtrC family response regulator
MTSGMEVPMDFSVLFVSPYQQDANSLRKMLDEASIPLVHASSLKDAANKLGNRDFAVVLTEANLGDGTWLDVLEMTKRSGTELIVTDAWADARFWAAAINLGAYDLLAQPFHSAEVRRVLTSASSRQANVKATAAVF